MTSRVIEAERMLRNAKMDYEQAKACEASYIRGRQLAKEILDRRQREYDDAVAETRRVRVP